MRIIHTAIYGLLVLTLFYQIGDAAQRWRKRPGNRAGRNNGANRANTDSGADFQMTSSLNVGGLSDAILDAFRPSMSDVTGGVGTSNRNNRGNQNNRRTMPAQSPNVNLTVEDIMEQYPWIENPDSIVDSTNSATNTAGVNRQGSVDTGNIGPSGINTFTTTSTPGASNARNRNRNDGKTRFNNPQYLREELDGLTLDDYGFTVTQGVPTTEGKYKVKLNQQWRGLPIYGPSIVLEQEWDTKLVLESADGEFISGVEDDIASETPTLTKEDAIQRALAYNEDQGKPMENPVADLIVDTIGDTAVLAYRVNYFIPGQEPQANVATQPPTTAIPTTTTTDIPYRYRGRRRCRRGRGGRGRNGRLCWYTRSNNRATNSLPTTQSPIRDLPEGAANIQLGPVGAKRPMLLMKANSGEIYKSWNALTAAIRPSRVNIRTGNPVYSIQNYREIMYKDDASPACYYQKPIGSGKFLRVNDKTTSNTANVYKFRCTDGIESNYDVTNGAASTRNSAFKWGSEAINFLKRASSSKWLFNINIETHHSGIHAVWNGKEVQLGDGDPTFFYPLTTPDTVTHEVTHAFTEHNSNLEYQYMSGAINEAYSDMAASAFLDYFFSYPEHQVYKIGRTALKFDTAIRDLCNPQSNALLLYNPNKPVISSALDYTLQTDLHNASALYSRAFCVLSKTAGWDIQQAFKVFTNANAIYWNPRETFNSAACGVKKAAYDLKNTAQSVADVDNAFAAVDIACNLVNWFDLAPAE